MQMDNDLEHSRIEKLNRDLHKQGASTNEEQLHMLPKDNTQVPHDFQAPIYHVPENVPHEDTPVREAIPRSMLFLRWFTVVAIASALGAIGYFAYQFLDPSGRPSPENISFTLSSPIAANPAAPIDFSIRIANKNNVALENVDVVLQLPSGAYEEKEGKIQPISEIKRSLGMITAGEIKEDVVRVFLLGDEQQVKGVQAKLSYKFITMGSVFTKTAKRDVRMLVSPLVANVETVKRVTAGTPTSLKVTVKSNTEVPLQNVLLQMDYPQGFAFTSAEPRAISNNALWVIPLLESGDEFVLEVRGQFLSEGATERVFHVSVGVADNNNSSKIGSVYAKALTPIIMESPFVRVRTLYGGKNPEDVIARYGMRMKGVLEVTNNTHVAIVNTSIELQISGTGLDEKTVDAGNGGMYRMQNNSITWDSRGNPSLAKMAPGATVKLEFSFIPDAGRVNGQYAANPEIVSSVRVTSSREGESGVVGVIDALSRSVVKIATQAEFAARALHFTGPIDNSGPIPPVVDQDTQLTILWTIRNTSNTIEQGTVRATLPAFVSWNNVVSPEKEKVSYDKVNNEVVWDIGAIPAGSGVGSVPPKEVAFQITLTPSVAQKGQTPNIIENQIFRGRDTFTGKDIEVKQPNLSSRLQYDPKAPVRSGEVVPQ